MANKKLTKQVKTRMIEALRASGKLSLVSKEFGVSLKTIYNERQRDPDFDKEVDTSMAEARTQIFEQVIDLELQAALTGYLPYSKPSGKGENVTYTTDFYKVDADVRRKFMNQLKREYLSYVGITLNKDGVVINNTNNASANADATAGNHDGDTHIGTFEMPPGLDTILEDLVKKHDSENPTD